jgi:CRP-like cAMP-binding protein
MKDFFPVLSQNPLFDNLDQKSLNTLLGCISPKRKKYEKDSFIFMEGDEVKSIGIVLSGAVHIVRDDYWGNREIVSRIESGELFGEVFACAVVQKLPVSAVAAERAEILLLDFNRIIRTCPAACAFHTKLIQNTVSVLARKNMGLMEKIECISQRSTREKTLYYLSTLAGRQKTGDITIPFNRQELADYLSVERSALSAELCRMRDEGLIDFYKNQFRLLKRKNFA